VDLRLPHQRRSILRLHAAAVQNPHRLRRRLADDRRYLLADYRVGLGCHLGSRGFACPNRPHRLIGNNDRLALRSCHTLKGLAHLPQQDLFHLPALALGQHLANANDRLQLMLERRQQFLVHRLVSLAKVLPPLRVAQNHMRHANRLQHHGRSLARKRALVDKVHILRARRNVRSRNRGNHHGERCVRRAKHNFVPVMVRNQRQKRMHKLLRLRRSLKHLPICCYDFLPHSILFFYLSVSASTPGSFFPSRNSSEAPPPVEMCVIWSATPAFFTAETESPPPTIEVASWFAATAFATFVVPTANGANSNTPIGPFPTLVGASPISLANSATAFGPLSHAIHTAGNAPSPSKACVLASAANLFASTWSTGSRNRTPFAAALARVSFARSILSASSSDFPISCPLAFRKV